MIGMHRRMEYRRRNTVHRLNYLLIDILMKNYRNNYVLLSILSIATLMASDAYAANTAVVNLSSASNFAVMAGTSITNVGSTIITGDIATSPGTTLTGFPQGTVFGNQQLGGAIAAQAQTDLGTAYADIASRSSTATVNGDLGGITLAPGFYRSISSIGINGNVTLDAQGDPNAIFVIQSVDTLNITAGSKVLLTGSAQACNVFWQSGSGVTVGTNASVAGSFIATNNISLANGALLSGRLLSQNGNVSLDTNLVSVPVCTPQPTTGSLRVITNVINDNGRTATPGSFTVRVRNASNTEAAGSPTSGSNPPGTLFTLASGSAYTVSADQSGTNYYAAQYSGDCNSTGNLYIQAGSSKTCTITLDDTPANDICPVRDYSASKWDGHCYTPVIAVTVNTTPYRVAFGGGSQMYTYSISNPGRIPLSNVGISDDGCAVLHPLAGDSNQNGLLDTYETWTYSCTAFVSYSTTNEINVSGNGDGQTAMFSRMSEVIVSTDPATTPVVVAPGFPNTGFGPGRRIFMESLFGLYHPAF